MSDCLRCLGDDITSLFDRNESLYSTGYPSLDACLPDGALAFHEIVELRASSPMLLNDVRHMVHHTMCTMLSGHQKDCSSSRNESSGDPRANDVAVHYLATRPQDLNLSMVMHRLLSDGAISLPTNDVDATLVHQSVSSSTSLGAQQPSQPVAPTGEIEARDLIEHATALAQAAAQCFHVYHTAHIGDVLLVLRQLVAGYHGNYGDDCDANHDGVHPHAASDGDPTAAGSRAKRCRVDTVGRRSGAAPHGVGGGSAKTCIVVIDNLVDLFAEDSLQYPKGNSVASSFIQADLARSLRVVATSLPRCAMLLINALVPARLGGGGAAGQRCHGGATWQGVADVALAIGDAADEPVAVGPAAVDNARRTSTCCVRVVRGGPQGQSAYVDV